MPTLPAGRAKRRPKKRGKGKAGANPSTSSLSTRTPEPEAPARTLRREPVARLGPIPPLDVPVLSQRKRAAVPPHPSSTAGGNAMDRLMNEREARLTEMQQRLTVWEENLKLAQVDQDSTRADLQAKMTEVTSLQQQWEQQKSALTRERAQLDGLCKRLKAREAAVACREKDADKLNQQQEKMRQELSVEHDRRCAELAERRQLMEASAVEVAERKLQAKERELQAQFETRSRKLDEREARIAAQRSELDVGIRDHRSRSNELGNLQEALQQREQELKTGAAELEAKRKDLASQDQAACAARAAAAAEFEARDAALQQRSDELQTKADALDARQRSLDASEQQLQDREIACEKVQEQNRATLGVVASKTAAAEQEHSVLVSQRQAVRRDRERLEGDQRRFEEEKSAFEVSSRGVRAQMAALEEREALLAAREAKIEAARRDNEATAAALKQRRSQLDEWDSRLELFGEECENQRATNEAEKVRLNMEATRLEQEAAELQKMRKGVELRAQQIRDAVRRSPALKKELRAIKLHGLTESSDGSAAGSAMAAVRLRQ